MRLKIITLIILLLYPIYIYASTNDGRISSLEEQAKNGNYYSMYRLGRILYENGQKTEAINYLNIACSKGKDQDACNYLKSINQNNPKYERIPKEANEIDKRSMLKDSIYYEDQYDEGLETIFAKGKDLFNEKIYGESYKIFNDLCENKGYYRGCLMLALQYKDGLGTTQNPQRAFVLYDYLRNKFKYSKGRDLCDVEMVSIKEYFMGTNKDIEDAKKIYENLKNSDNIDFSQFSKDALSRRIPTYNFVKNFVNSILNFKHKKIDYKTFEAEMEKLNLDILSEDSRNIFLEMKPLLLKIAKFDDFRRNNKLSIITGAAAKGFNKDLSVFSDIIQLFRENDENKKAGKEWVELLYKFFKQLNNERMSSAFLKNEAIRLGN